MDILLELEDYRDHLVLGGGWASHFVLKRFEGAGHHQGSADVDFVIEPSAIKSEIYSKISSAIARKGFRPYETNSCVTLPYRFYREVTSPIDNRTHVVKIDFITEPIVTGKNNAQRFIMGKEGVGAVAIRGIGVVLQNNFECRIRGTLPSGLEDSVKFKVADLAGCLTTKALALRGRYKRKDLYDFMNLLRCNPKGLRVTLIEIGATNDNVLTLKEAMGRITKSSIAAGTRSSLAFVEYPPI